MKNYADYKDKLLERSEVEKKLIDFKNMFKSFSDKYPNMTRFFIYRLYANKFDYDCDVLCEVLEKLVNENTNKCFANAEFIQQLNYNKYYYKYEIMCGNGKVFRGDTINSFWTTFKAFLQNCMTDELNLVDGNIPHKYREKGVNNDGIWIYHFCKNYTKIQDKDKLIALSRLDSLAKNYHSLGNFMITPVDHIKFKYFDKQKGRLVETENSFNCARGLIEEIHDYFDLTLKEIEKYYTDEQENLLIQNTNKHWLEIYGTFENFIDENCFKMYVDEISDENGNKKYTVKPLFNTLNREKTLPQNIGEFNTFLETALEQIELRNKEVNQILGEA